jgi:tetratricopeptide (TPR) repeat protein
MFALCLSLVSCASSAASAEEYYAIGMAYFDMGKYAEAEVWLTKARAADKTMTASEYNLGRIAFETGRYDEAARRFSQILTKDPSNVMALKAAAYTSIKTGDFDAAYAYYRRVLDIVPESVDDGYNYALVLYAIEKYDEAEAVLSRYPTALMENSAVILVYARVQKAQGKPEAINTYAQWLETNNDPAVRVEYAECLEQEGLFARAIEEYRSAYRDLPADSKRPTKAALRYALARALLIADSENEEGALELEGAVTDGFADLDALQSLLQDSRISGEHKVTIQRLIDAASAPVDAATPPAETPQ